MASATAYADQQPPTSGKYLAFFSFDLYLAPERYRSPISLLLCPF